MPRLAVPFRPGVPAPRTLTGLPGDDYKDRLVKYIPAESVALYTFTDKMFAAYYGIGDAGLPTKMPPDFLFDVLPGFLFVLGLIGTPIYLYRQRLPGQPWKIHALLSTIAFVLWAYTLEGSLFLVHHWYHVLLAGLAAPIFTFVAGWIEPR